VKLSGSDEFLEVTIQRRTVEADGIVSLDLAAADGVFLPAFEAGAHVDVHVGPGVVRQYSLCNDPAETHRYRLAVLLEPESRGGSSGIHALEVGRTIRIGVPRNNFKLVEGATHHVLMAGGIGVTPLLAMAYRLHAQGASFELHYCTRSRTRTAFLEDIAAASFAGQVTIHHDDGPAEQRFAPETGLPAPAPGVHLYVCGPTGFMDWVIAGARARGYTEDHLHLEYFTAEISMAGDSFTVEARRSGKVVQVPSGKSIAEALAEIGIDLPLSCEQGVCGTCLTDVIAGLPDHRDMYQTDGEKAANKQITPCCSRSLSAVLVLDV
jgi:ferredoxin-NADP reductase